MDQEVMDNLKEIFANVDKTGDGTISDKDIGFFLRASGLNPSLKEIKAVQDEVNSEKVSFEIAVTFFKNMSQKQVIPPRQQFIEVFKVWDRDCNGLIPSAELNQVLSALGDRMKPDELKSCITQFEDHNGLVRYEELVDWVLKA